MNDKKISFRVLSVLICLSVLLPCVAVFASDDSVLIEEAPILNLSVEYEFPENKGEPRVQATVKVNSSGYSGITAGDRGRFSVSFLLFVYHVGFCTDMSV